MIFLDENTMRARNAESLPEGFLCGHFFASSRETFLAPSRQGPQSKAGKVVSFVAPVIQRLERSV